MKWLLRKPNLDTLVLLLLFCPINSTAAQEQESTPQNSPPIAADSSERLLADLGAKDFAVRSDASARLKNLSAEELLSLSEELPEQPNAEVVVRVQAELESRYASLDAANVQAASKALEAQAQDQRLMLADVAQQSLRRHWKRRIDIAVKELEGYGASILRGALTRPRTFNPFPGRGGDTNSINIFLTETWTGGDAEIDVFQRLAALCGPVTSESSGVKVYLLLGNPLTEEQVKRLTDSIGQNRVAKRSRVALGISPAPTNSEGVLIYQVTPGSSADNAGLREGDLIVAIEPKFVDAKDEDKDVPQTAPKDAEDKTLVRDFDDLVERLMDYREGDIMTVRVRRAVGYAGGRFRPEGQLEPKLETVKVKMKSWKRMVPE